MNDLKFRVLLLGGTGTIGRATAAALLAAGHGVWALVRPGTDPAKLPGCKLIEADVSHPDTVARVLKDHPCAAIVSCLASRTGLPADAWAIDDRAHAHALEAAMEARVRKFVLLSAICVQKPYLEFQKAKLAFEAQLRGSPLEWSIVRPTAFFKSLSGQIPRVQAGKPFLVFGDGRITACKPISDADLGRFITSCLSDPEKIRKVLPIGGPGPAITPLDQAAMLERLTGKPVKIRHVTPKLMDAIVGVLTVFGKFSPKLAAKAELARIGRYYATESMLLWNPAKGCYDADATPEYGTERFEDYVAAMLRGEIADDRGDHAIF